MEGGATRKSEYVSVLTTSSCETSTEEGRQYTVFDSIRFGTASVVTYSRNTHLEYFNLERTKATKLT